MTFYTYLLKCADGSFYTGHTDDLDARLMLHRMGLLHGYTHSRRSVQLVWFDSFESRDDAFRCERQIKGWSRAKKEALIAEDWERIRYLAAIRSTDRDRSKFTHPSSASG